MTTTKTKQGELTLPGKGGHYQQKGLDGKVIKETVDPKIQEDGDYWLGKKYAAAKAKEVAEEAMEKFLTLMRSKKKTSVVIFDTEKNCKRRVNIVNGTEKLKLEKVGLND